MFPAKNGGLSHFKSACAALAEALLVLCGCHFMDTVINPEPEDASAGALKFDRSEVTLDIGDMVALNLDAEKNQGAADIEWACDGEKLIKLTHDNWGAVITGIEPGQAVITASCAGYSASCVVTVTTSNYKPKIENPYVYASQDVLNLRVGDTETISAAAYGGAGSAGGYTWSCDKPGIASIAQEGAYCRVKAMAPGQAKITVRNPTVSALQYSVLVNVSGDGIYTPYITTTRNVVSVNTKDGKPEEFTVRVENSPNGSSDNSLFSFAVLSADEKPLAEADWPAAVYGQGNTFLVEPRDAGTCIVRISHQDAPYSMDVIVRVGTEPSLTYVELDQRIVTLTSAASSATVRASLMNPGTAAEDTSRYVWEWQEGAERYVDWQINGGDNRTKGNILIVTPKANGVVKFSARYPSEADNTASVTFVVKNIESEGKDAETYISTSQNYVRAYSDGDPVKIDVRLVNAPKGEEDRIHWELESLADDGSGEDVIAWKEGTGTHSRKTWSRSAIAPSTDGWALITPLRPGKAVITLSHPRAMYPTTITVKVTERPPEAEPKWYLSAGVSSMTLIGGKAEMFPVLLTGDGATENDYSDIAWSCSCPDIQIERGAGEFFSARYTGSGRGSASVEFSHPRSDQRAAFSVVYAMTEGDAKTVKTISSGTARNQTVYTGDRPQINAEILNGEPEDWISWESENPSVIYIESSDSSGARLRALSAGRCAVTGTFGGAEKITFMFTVKEPGKVFDGDDAYLTTSTAALYFENRGGESAVKVSAVNLDGAGISGIVWSVWEIENGIPKKDADGKRIPSGSFSVAANGESAIITAEEYGAEAVLSVSHRLSENELLIPLRCGERFDWRNSDFAYVQADAEIVELRMGGGDRTVTAVLAHTESDTLDDSDISFSISDSAVAAITRVSNSVYIRPVMPGTATLTASHPNASEGISLEIPVIVKDREDPSKIPYLTTQSNVVTIIEGETAAASASLVNAVSQGSAEWLWQVEDTNICEITAPVGNTVLIKGKSPGATPVTVTNIQAESPLHLVAVVTDGKTAAANPYIQTSRSIVTLQPSKTEDITASLIGGIAGDSVHFTYSSDNPAVAIAQGNGGSCRIQAVSKGTATITVRNNMYPGAYSKPVLVIVRDTAVEGCEISLDTTMLTLEPDSRKTQTVTATLENGEPTDAKNFSWWLEDASFADIQTNAGECLIRPTGKAGVTTLRVEHPKVLAARTITLSFSRYGEFAFAESELKITSGSLAFVSVNVPYAYSGAQVRFSSADENVALAAGTGKTCMVQGAHGAAGITAIRAGLYIDGRCEATAECRVEVVPESEEAAVITTQSTMIKMEAGESRFVGAEISGQRLPGNAKDRLVWEIVSALPAELGEGEDLLWDSKGIDIMQNSGEKATGENAYITAHDPGEYIVRISYKDTAARVSGQAFLLITVPERKETVIMLSSSSLVHYSNDRFELTATLFNAPAGAEQQIRWSVDQDDRRKIVEISAFASGTRGAKCSFVATNTGTCAVRATYGDKTQTCFVTVKSAGRLIVGTTNITVFPQGSERIYYSTEPANAAVTWQMSTKNPAGDPEGDPFTFVNNSAEKYIEVTGLRNYGNDVAGEIYGILGAEGSRDAQQVTIYVKVNYTCEFTVWDDSQSWQYEFRNPKNDSSDYLKLNYSCFPSVMDVAWGDQIEKQLDGCVQIVETRSEVGYDKEGRLTRTGYVVLKPVREFSARTVTFRAEAPAPQNTALNKERTKEFTCYYTGYNFEMEWLPLKEGAFSYEKKNSRGELVEYHLGDGEGAVCRVTVKEPLADITEIKVRYTAGNPVMGYECQSPGLVYHQGTVTQDSTRGQLVIVPYVDGGVGGSPSFDGTYTVATIPRSQDGSFVFGVSHKTDIYSNMADDGQLPEYAFKLEKSSAKGPYYDRLITKNLRVSYDARKWEEYTVYKYKRYKVTWKYGVQSRGAPEQWYVYSKTYIEDISSEEKKTSTTPSASRDHTKDLTTNYYYELQETEQCHRWETVSEGDARTWLGEGWSGWTNFKENTSYPARENGVRNGEGRGEGSGVIAEASLVPSSATAGFPTPRYLYADDVTDSVIWYYGYFDAISHQYFETTRDSSGNITSTTPIQHKTAASAEKCTDPRCKARSMLPDWYRYNEHEKKESIKIEHLYRKYDDCTPYVISEEDFLGNANYYSPKFQRMFCVKETCHGIGNYKRWMDYITDPSDDDYKLCEEHSFEDWRDTSAWDLADENPVEIHRYAERITAVNSTIREQASGTFTLQYKSRAKTNWEEAKQPDNKTPLSLNLVIDVRYCKAYTPQWVKVRNGTTAMKTMNGGDDVFCKKQGAHWYYASDLAKNGVDVTKSGSEYVLK